MGYHLALLADQQTTISPRAKIVLARMCWHARDTPKDDTPARVYFGGWEALQLLFPNATDTAAREAVKRSLRELRDAGLIKPTTPNPSRRQTQRYEITL